MPIRRLCPTHIFVAPGSAQDVTLTRALAEATLAEIAGFQVWVRGRSEARDDASLPVQIRFDLAPLTTSRID